MSSTATLDHPSIPSESDEAAWHRRVCWVSPWLALSGDLHQDNHRAVAQIGQWIDQGVTDILDVREEYSDEVLVADVAPDMRYWWVPTNDRGGHQDPLWFEAGLAATADLMADAAVTPTTGSPVRRVLVHCHMGVNRGPSMGLRLLLAGGWDLIEALDAIRAARPIAAVLYADDALDDHLRLTHASPAVARAEHARLHVWQNRHPIDLARIIGRIRHAEYS